MNPTKKTESSQPERFPIPIYFPCHWELYKSRLWGLRTYIAVGAFLILALFPTGDSHLTLANALWEERVKPALPDYIEKPRKEWSRKMRRFFRGH